MSSARSLSFLMPAKIIFVPLTNLRAVGRRAASPDATRGVAHWEVAAQRAARVFGPSSSRPAAGPRPVNAGCDNSWRDAAPRFFGTLSHWLWRPRPT